jgi:hypothetical protein
VLAIKKLPILLLILSILFLIVPGVQATDYLSLKNEYIQTHPGQSIIPFPWEPTTSIKVLPFNYAIPAAPGNTLSVTACRNEFEPASFILNAQKDLTGITITVPNLYDGQGNSIPSSAINIRLVKVWYQASGNNYWLDYTTADHVLTPELLINDDSLIKVDYVTKTNYLKVTMNGVEQYIDISNPSATFPSNAQIRDASSLQPFSLKANENKQIWITVHVPSTTPAGNYSGNIAISAPSGVPVVMNFSVRVLPFDLEPAPIDYGLYYTGIIHPGVDTNDVVGATYKTPATYLTELQDMKDHGVLYPTLFQQDNTKLDTVLRIIETAGLPHDKIYLLGSWSGHNAYIGNGKSPAELAAIAATVINWRNHTETYGYQNTYFYGIGEAQTKGINIQSQRPAWQQVHTSGGKIFTDGFDYEMASVADIVDTGITAYTPNTTAVGIFHGYNHKIMSYGNPQVGIENPEIYRKNYGFALLNAGYDGTMDFAYQYTEGKSIWNDYDAPTFDGIHKYRDHVFAYPTTNGVIDTIQWEGFREGVDDTRYADTLTHLKGSNITARTIISDSLAKGEDMETIRKKVIEQILSPLPTAFEKLKISIFRSAYGFYISISTSMKRIINPSFGEQASMKFPSFPQHVISPFTKIFSEKENKLV